MPQLFLQQREEESGKGERDVHWVPSMGPLPFSRGGPTALFRVVTELSTILRMSASPFLCPGAAAFHGGQVSVSTGSASPQNWVIAMTCSLLGRPGG